MNVNDIASLCNALSIGEKEMPATILDVNLKDRGEQRLALCLVGKVLASKVVNREAFVDVLKRIWRVNGGVEIEAIEDNIFEFQFKSLEARKRILSVGPWRLMERSSYLRNLEGEVRSVDLEAGKSGSCRFIQVRVVIKVVEPLSRSLRVDLLGNGKITTMLLRYERVPDFCYKCNRLAHNLGECSVPGDNREATTEANIRLCTWMRTSSPLKKQLFYGNGIGRVEQGKRDWRDRGYGILGQKEVMRSQGNWRNMQKQSKLDGSRKGIIRVVGEKENIGSPAANVACSGIKGSINDPAVSEVHGKSMLGVCQKNGSEVEKDMDIVESIEETGEQSGVKFDILNTDKSIDTEVDLGMDPNKGPPMVSNSDNLSGPIVMSNVGECSEFGPGLISKSITTWKRIRRGDKGNQNQLNLGVKLGKRDGLNLSEEKQSEIKRYKESLMIVVDSVSQQKSGDVPVLVGVDERKMVLEEMEARTQSNNGGSTVESETRISAGRSLPTSRIQ
ncbi:hypothetical protein Q3G72_028842 [Acer saccharum]|nr:hypothetical protein Q3G72_028842 [Acer saccharum]